jgi:cytochrome b subunit of formate dehydrogenase
MVTDQWKFRKNKNQTEQEKIFNFFFHLFRIGLKLTGCIKLTNSGLGPIMFAEISLAFFNLAIYAYFICTIYSLFIHPFSWVILLFIVHMFLMSFLAVYRIGHLTLASENLNHELQLAVDHLQNFKASIPVKW